MGHLARESWEIGKPLGEDDDDETEERRGLNARFFAPALSLSAAASPCFAGEEHGPYTMTPVGDSVLRLDSATGAVSICGRKLGGWSCESVADVSLINGGIQP